MGCEWMMCLVGYKLCGIFGNLGLHSRAVHSLYSQRIESYKTASRKPGASNRRTKPEPNGGASLCRLGFGGGDLGRDNLSGTENSKGARCEDVERGTSIPLVCTGEVPLEREGTVNRAPPEVRTRGRTDGNLRLFYPLAVRAPGGLHP